MTTGGETTASGSFFSRLKTSPRAQRRLFFVSLVVFAVGAVALVSVVFWNSNAPEVSSSSDVPAQVLRAQTPVGLSAEAKEAGIAWIAAAVTRTNLASAFDMTHPDIRGAMTRKEWATGNIPVVPYPADVKQLGDRWRVSYSYADEALVEVGLIPSASAPDTIDPLTFYLGLKLVGKGAKAHWVVNYWSPRYKPPVRLAQ